MTSFTLSRITGAEKAGTETEMIPALIKISNSETNSLLRHAFFINFSFKIRYKLWWELSAFGWLDHKLSIFVDHNLVWVHLCGCLYVVFLFTEKAEAAPRPEAMWKCEGLACFPKAAPICAVDASGEMRSFINECFMELAYCREMKCKLI